MNVYNSVSSWVDVLSNSIAIVLLILSLLIPVLCYIKIRKMFTESILDNQKALEQFGELYEA